MKEKDLTTLIGELPGLEVAKKAIQERIDEIHRHISGANVRLFPPTVPETTKFPAPSDPTVLGIDSIGRVIRRRTFSPETLAQKREAIRRAREVRMEQLRRLRESQRQHEGSKDTA